jgi:hypothetical protein
MQSPVAWPPPPASSAQICTSAARSIACIVAVQIVRIRLD